VTPTKIDIPLTANGLKETMRNASKDRSEIISHLEAALGLANGLNQGILAYLIERAIDEARALDFRLPT
jgi:hypothetical protein